MRVLLTGATGLVGREVGKCLAALGHELVVLSRGGEGSRAQLPFPARIYAWDGRSAPPVGALAGIEGVIHLAGESVGSGRWTQQRKREIRDSRLVGTQALVTALRALPPRVFVSGSAIGYYGDREDQLLGEDSAPGQDFLASLCVEWEACANALQAVGTRVVCVRTGMVVARHGGAMEKILPPFLAGVGSPLGSGRQWMSWIHLVDIARMFAFALTNEKVQGPINGVAPEPVTNKDFSVVLAKLLGRKLLPLAAPALVLRLALGEMAVLVLGSQKVGSEKAKELGFSYEYPRLGHALAEVTKPFAEGEREFLAEQWLPAPPAKLFPFFSDEKNLERLTPSHLCFRVEGKSTKAIEEGTLIDYRLRLHGLPFGWRTRIEEWHPPEKFVDTQLRGPYRKWHHTHEFHPLAGGTLMTDRVRYVVPLGALGRLVVGGRVAKEVAGIFAFRRKAIAEIFRA